MQVNTLEARNQLSRLIERAESGEEVVIARRGKPVAKLVPYKDDEPPIGSAAALARVFAGWEPLPPMTPEEIADELREIKEGWPERE